MSTSLTRRMNAVYRVVQESELMAQVEEVFDDSVVFRDPVGRFWRALVTFDATDVPTFSDRSTWTLVTGVWENAPIDFIADGIQKYSESRDPRHNAIKAVDVTDDELRVANYMVLFGHRDLEGIASKRKNLDGSRGEFFTQKTIFESDYTANDSVVVDWEHGIRETDPDVILGRVDWKSARLDERGLFVERVLKRRHKYVKFLEDLIEAGLVANSTESVTDRVRTSKNGEILEWPIRRDTLTVTPMDPHMIWNDNVLRAVKALTGNDFISSEVSTDAEAETPKTGSQPVVTVAKVDKELEERRKSILEEILLLEISLLEVQ